MALTAQVAVNQATLHFDKLYSYLVPEHLAQKVRIGSMVLVPFGYQSKKPRMGVVLGVDDTQETKRLKQLYDVAPEKAALTPELLSLVHLLREQTFCTYYEAVKAIIPYGAQYKAMEENGRPCLKKQIQRHTEAWFSQNVLPQKKLTEKQYKAWDLLANGPLPFTELEQHGITKTVLTTLVKNGVLCAQQRDKTQELYAATHQAAPIALSTLQEKAFSTLNALLQTGTPKAALLYGVTSSGKTLVFLRLIEECLLLGRQALVLVPEISLTPQMIVRLKSHFGSRVAVQHSALNHTERLLQWQQIQSGSADIVVGTRSAIFAPLENIGLIIIDEEQEHTYHSESAPRYTAHEIAKHRVAAHGALLLLASATPSTESYYAAQQGRYELVELPERYQNRALPQVSLVDMREELAQGNAGAFSSVLQEEIRKNLQLGNQTILLLNRRGYKTVGMCRACSEVLQCPSCSVPMVYHKSGDKLLCHYCGHTIAPPPQTCPKCEGEMRYTGLGTQRIEEELAEKFPTARVLRMDADSTGRKNAHEKMLGQFAAGQYDIMIGTQMVAKGLDFEKVTLVGVLGIDQMLFAQGYKAFENVFSLVTQVVGRSGRSTQEGRAIIQTVDPNHPVLNLAARQDYTAFYAQEIAFRKLNLYPPFCSICTVGFSGAKEAEVLQAATAFAALTRNASQQQLSVPLRILGPAEMHILMINNTYRYKLTIKCRNDKAFRALMRQVVESYSAQKLPQKAAVTLDFYADSD